MGFLPADPCFPTEQLQGFFFKNQLRENPLLMPFSYLLFSLLLYIKQARIKVAAFSSTIHILSGRGVTGNQS